MKLFWKIFGCLLLIGLVTAYLLFLFLLPKKVDLNVYKSEIQKLALEQGHVNVDFDNIRLITTPALEAGIVIDNLQTKLPDNSDLLKFDRLKAKVFLPAIFILQARVNELSIDNPEVNIEIKKDGSQYKIMEIVQDIINEHKQAEELKAQQPVEEEQGFKFNPKWIRIKVLNIALSDYKVLVNDLSSGHSLTLKGDILSGSFNNMKTAHAKTVAQILSDNNVNVTANLDIDSYIPKPKQKDEDDDPAYRSDMSFTNPVKLYRDYDLRTNIGAKLKIRKTKDGQTHIAGFTGVENLTMNLSGYQLPESYIRAIFRGNSANLDTNLYVTSNQYLKLYGLFNFSKHPKLDLNITSTKIYFKDLLVLTKAFMDTLHIKNDLNITKGLGYVHANARVRTNFKYLKSNGGIVVRDGAIVNNNIGLKNINANILFKNRVMEIKDTYLYVNNAIMKIQGMINSDGAADISVLAEKLPFSALFKAFAPVDLKRNYNVNSGDLYVKANISGKLKQPFANADVVLSNLDFANKDRSLGIRNEKMEAKFETDVKTLTGLIHNKNFSASIPKTASNIGVSDLSVVISPENVELNPFVVNVNKNSKILVEGSIAGYNTNPLISLNAFGKMHAVDLRQFLGKELVSFVDAKGILPIKLAINGDNRRQHIRFQAKADENNYITPIHASMVQGKQTIAQLVVNYKGDRLNIKDTGLFLKNIPSEFTDDFDANVSDTTQLSKLSGTIARLNTSSPFINRINLSLPENFEAKLHIFPRSVLHLGGQLLVFGKASSPFVKGNFKLSDVVIPEIYTSLKNLDLNFVGKLLQIDLSDLIMNGSDIQITNDVELVPSDVININNLDIKSRKFELEKVLKTVDALNKYLPSSGGNTSASKSSGDIPVKINNGTINFREIAVSPLVLNNTTGNISLNKNIFRLNNLSTSTMGGKVSGDVSANLLSLLVKANLEGENFDVEKSLLTLANVKDAISGTAFFSTDLMIDGAAKTQNDIIKGIDGTIDFEILKGQLGPFGHLENLILAENIRESQFFQTALGGVINSLTSIETSHFDDMTGHVAMQDGIVVLSPIDSVGPVMCMHIFGNMNLLTNNLDIKLRARLGSQVADLLGPIAALNPVNLVKATPGLNVAAAKAFSLFSESLTPEELDEIPNFDDSFGAMSTTNFQVVLRGDVAKPLSLIKSFKWLATTEQMNLAKAFADSLPEVDPENPDASVEELQEIQKKKEGFFKKIFKGKKANKQKIDE